jgi:MYXO-CTERM domain-containing protein
MHKLLGATLALVTTLAAQAAPVTMEFSASGFQNLGVQFPGFSGPVSGRISWEQAQVGDPISSLTSIELTIAGFSYALAEVALANQGTTDTVVGGVANGANAVIGSGAAHDFLMVFNRVSPSISAFSFAIQGKAGALWTSPGFTEARFVTAAVPEPASALLALTALGLVASHSRRRQARPRA